jgi:hypothetical protein
VQPLVAQMEFRFRSSFQTTCLPLPAALLLLHFCYTTAWLLLCVYIDYCVLKKQEFKKDLKRKSKVGKAQEKSGIISNPSITFASKKREPMNKSACTLFKERPNCRGNSFSLPKIVRMCLACAGGCPDVCP